MNELYAKGITESKIIYLPLDRRGFKSIKTPEQLEEKIESMIGDEEFYYLFIDEQISTSTYKPTRLYGTE